MNLVTAGMVFGMVGEVAVTSVGGAQAKPTAKFLKAVAQVESGGNDWLVGDKHLRQKAYGRGIPVLILLISSIASDCLF